MFRNNNNKQYLPKNTESTVWLRVEGRPEGPPTSRLLSLRGFGSSGSWTGRYTPSQ